MPLNIGCREPADTHVARATRWQLLLAASVTFVLIPTGTRSQAIAETPRDIIRATRVAAATAPGGAATKDRKLKSRVPSANVLPSFLLAGFSPSRNEDRFAAYTLIPCQLPDLGRSCPNLSANNSDARTIPFEDRQIFDPPESPWSIAVRPIWSSELRQGDAEPSGDSSSTTAESAKEGFHWWPMLQQSFNFLVFEHAFRIASDPFLRYLLWHKPFWLDYGISTQHFFFNHWGDGDDFLVNYIGHPLQGAVTGNIEIVNDPKGRSLTFGRSKAYWMSRLRAMAWSAVYSAQFEAGPMLSEAAIGNEGGYFYRRGCDPNITCAHPSHDPITNNTGWVDFVVTPLIGTGWIVLEDSIETEIVDKLAKGDDRLRWKLLRAGLSPGHVMANFMAGKVPWYRYRLDGPDGGSIFGREFAERPKFSWDDVQRWEVGGHYAYLNLPMDWEGCTKCRVNNSGAGMNFAYRITNHLWFDSDVNFFPGSGNAGEKGHTIEGLFGPRYGLTRKSWGLYFKVRPGFIYYDKTLTADSGENFTVATRFAFDVGSEFEWHTSRHSTIRVDAGTTFVRYLTGIVDPRQPQKAFISNEYIVSQGNFQIGTGYTYRF